MGIPVYGWDWLVVIPVVWTIVAILAVIILRRMIINGHRHDRRPGPSDLTPSRPWRAHPDPKIIP